MYSFIGTALLYYMVRQITQTNAYSSFLLGLKAPETSKAVAKKTKILLRLCRDTRKWSG